MNFPKPRIPTGDTPKKNVRIVKVIFLDENKQEIPELTEYWVLDGYSNVIQKPFDSWDEAKAWIDKPENNCTLIP